MAVVVGKKIEKRRTEKKRAHLSKKEERKEEVNSP